MTLGSLIRIINDTFEPMIMTIYRDRKKREIKLDALDGEDNQEFIPVDSVNSVISFHRPGSRGPQSSNLINISELTKLKDG